MKTSKFERIAFGLGDAGCNFVWTTISMFLTIYLTDNVGIAAAVVGNIMIFTRLLDGVTDLGMGYIIDHTKSKYGKTRPWILRSAPFMGLGVILLFNVPSGFSDVSAIVYVTVIYVFVAAFAYTAANLAYSTLLSFITDNQQERSLLTTIRFICTMVAALMIAMVTPRLVPVWGYGKIAIIYGILSTILLLITFYFTKERNQPVKKESIPIGEGIDALLKNRYFFSATILTVLLYVSSSLVSGAGIYFARDVMGNANYFGTITLVQMAPTLIALAFLPSITNKFGKWKTMILAAILQIVGALIIAISPETTTFVYVGTVFRGLGGVPLVVGLFSILADIVDYGEWKTGKRVDGLTYSASSFGMKVGTGIGSASVGWLLAFGNYDPNLSEQGALTISIFKLMYVYMPIIIAVMVIFVLLTLNVDKIYSTISEELKVRRAESKE